MYILLIIIVPIIIVVMILCCKSGIHARSNNHVLDENDPYLYFTKLARFKNELF